MVVSSMVVQVEWLSGVGIFGRSQGSSKRERVLGLVGRCIGVAVVTARGSKVRGNSAGEIFAQCHW